MLKLSGSVSTEGVAPPQRQVSYYSPVAFGLSVAGLVVQIVSLVWTFSMLLFYSGQGNYNWGFMGGMMGGYYNGMMGWYNSPGLMGGWEGGIWLLIAGLIVVLGAIGVLKMRSNRRSSVTTGSILVLITALIAYPTMWGFFAGSLLMAIGGIVGLATTSG